LYHADAISLLHFLQGNSDNSLPKLEESLLGFPTFLISITSSVVLDVNS
jgi:hypothetical protein